MFLSEPILTVIKPALSRTFQPPFNHGSQDFTRNIQEENAGVNNFVTPPTFSQFTQNNSPCTNFVTLRYF
jgi:hypothetical protein